MRQRYLSLPLLTLVVLVPNLACKKASFSREEKGRVSSNSDSKKEPVDVSKLPCQLPDAADCPTGNPGGTPGGNPGGTPGGTPGGNPGGTPGGTPDGNPGGTPGGTPGGNPGGTAGGTPGGNPGGTPGGTPGGNPGGTPGGLPQPGGDKEKSVTFEVSCQGSRNTVRPSFDVAEPAGTKLIATFKGELCPEAKRDQRVLFVVDFSGSMGKHDSPITGQQGHPGNDPLVGGTCGRLEAAKKILAKYATAEATNVDMGLIPFSDDIVFDREVNPMSVAEFSAKYLNTNYFCGYVIQYSKYANEPGAISPNRSYGSGTEYGSALSRVERYISEKSVRSTVYFITDGEPNNRNSGITAARRLSRYANLSFFSLLLSHDAANARDILEQITPDREASVARVVDVANAGDITAAVDKFTAPTIVQNSGKAVLSIAPFRNFDLGLIRGAAGDFEPRPNNVWAFTTQPFVLLGRPGRTVRNLVEVSGIGNDGVTYSSTVEINYLIQ